MQNILKSIYQSFVAKLITNLFNLLVLGDSQTLGIALLAVSWQSWKASTRNPVEALKYE